ncbi:MmcQ/YjbR family DNA-binding protein [Roseicyclus mahoneyensis]|uniref:Putative DNA-binding protein (MmcQ/YjbR family) n=1 Tax=Roseicyclus mahoneyensis TaxID=164332 RepID=A0A316GP98_9RHOB|nr:MmcQ/YjbR family DNA-binding protein [Roseicyclus mahoneyensis]PWK62599.1 putative DNA-binding protein (MmcQ/YjbR family) [Roseicyclus mahoneyensis]
MRHDFVDRHCRAMPRAERATPFGPETVVWKINGHMFAAYTDIGPGLSVRTSNLTRALAVIRQSRPASAPYLTGGGWVLLPWETAPEELRLRLIESYNLVRRDWPQAAPDRRGVAQDD